MDFTTHRLIDNNLRMVFFLNLGYHDNHGTSRYAMPFRVRRSFCHTELSVELGSNAQLSRFTCTGSMPSQLNNPESLNTLHDYRMAQSGLVQFAGLLKCVSIKSYPVERPKRLTPKNTERIKQIAPAAMTTPKTSLMDETMTPITVVLSAALNER